MSDPHNKTEIAERLSAIQQAVYENVQGMSVEQFNNGNDADWAASGYLKHLILAIKPLAKGMGLPSQQLVKMFGQAENPSRSFTDVTTAYDQRLADGIKAEMAPTILPSGYRMPDGVEDEHAYLLDTWMDANHRLLTAMDNWSEDDLDTHQLPHPAVGMLTLREMLFFTIHHNTMHAQDIQNAGSRV